MADPTVSAVTSQIPFATMKKEQPPPWAPLFRASSLSSHPMQTIMETRLVDRLWHGWRQLQPSLQGSQGWLGIRAQGTWREVVFLFISYGKL